MLKAIKSFKIKEEDWSAHVYFMHEHSNPLLLLKPSHPIDYYKVFNLNRNATEDDVKSAYKKLARVYHLDKNLGNEKEAE